MSNLVVQFSHQSSLTASLAGGCQGSSTKKLAEDVALRSKRSITLGGGLAHNEFKMAIKP